MARKKAPPKPKKAKKKKAKKARHTTPKAKNPFKGGHGKQAKVARAIGKRQYKRDSKGRFA